LEPQSRKPVDEPAWVNDRPSGLEERIWHAKVDKSQKKTRQLKAVRVVDFGDNNMHRH